MTFLLTCALLPPVTALPLTADPAPDPDPNQDQAPANAPARIARLLAVLHKLITHGKLMAVDLANDLNRPRPGSMIRVWIAVRFCSNDFALILARITRALQMALALKAMLAQGQQRPRRARPDRPAPADREPRTQPRRNAKAAVVPIPTSKEIAALLRDRSIGQVLTEICLDFGILTVESFWQDLEAVLLENGADLARITEDAEQRIRRCDQFLPPYLREAIQPSPPQPAAPLPTAAPDRATGPP